MGCQSFGPRVWLVFRKLLQDFTSGGIGILDKIAHQLNSPPFIDRYMHRFIRIPSDTNGEYILVGNLSNYLMLASMDI